MLLTNFSFASSGSVALLSGFRSTLRDSPPPPISLYVENLDLGRFGGGRFNDAVQAYFREKYHDKPIGVIVAVGAAALRLVLGLRNALWAEMPVIFAAVDEGVTDRLVLPPKVTGLTVRAPLSDSASVARAVVPDLKRLAIVGDPPERQFIRAGVAEQLKRLATEFELIDLTRLTMTELKRRVASLPSDSVIIYIGLTLDAGNVAYTSSEALAAFAGVAGRPIVVQAENQLGTGAIGGIVASPALIGRETARLVLHVLAGENPLNIPVTTASVEVQLQQVILNLVMNAIEAMHSAEPRVLSVRSELSEFGGVCVSVEDTGTGIDASSADQVFKPLFTTKASGMGMGLSICHSIIQNHNGRIWVSAGPKKGTIFKFVLPAIEPGARDPEDGLPVAGGGLPPKMKQLRVEGTPPAEVKDHGSAH